MLRTPTMESLLLAYQQARAAAAAAAEIEAELRYALIHDAHSAGKSVREIADMLGIPKSTIARIRLAQAAGPAPWRGPAMGPGGTWMTPEAYVQAHNAAWRHDESQHVDSAPFGFSLGDDGRQRIDAVPMTTRGVAHFR